MPLYANFLFFFKINLSIKDTDSLPTVNRICTVTQGGGARAPKPLHSATLPSRYTLCAHLQLLLNYVILTLLKNITIESLENKLPKIEVLRQTAKNAVPTPMLSLWLIFCEVSFQGALDAHTRSPGSGARTQGALGLLTQAFLDSFCEDNSFAQKKPS